MACGLTPGQAECNMYLHLALHMPDSSRQLLPSDEQLRTPEEALRIYSNQTFSVPDPPIFSSNQIYRCLHVPCSQWMAAKAAIAERFGCTDADAGAGHRPEIHSERRLPVRAAVLQIRHRSPGFIEWMLRRGMTPAQILAAMEKDPHILIHYHGKEDRIHPERFIQEHLH